ncbi:ATP-binding cassette sub- B member 5 [Geranomyces variabilis]|uniref:ATP-binding cassette sub- B member 5 n=1 Tax=Geranomyces variabilis TaxID=109894 RepID=A0AAD5XM42_9FUNG|nr:ATP-binding cassette sub- B member 5 [Geranomyces variabilis]
MACFSIYPRLWSRAEPTTKGHVVLGVLSSFVCGLCIPALNFISTRFITASTPYELPGGEALPSIWLATEHPFIALGVMSFAAFAANALNQYLWSHITHTTTLNLRRQFMASVLSQDLKWINEKGLDTLATSITSSVEAMESAYSAKAANLIEVITFGVASIALGFFSSWRLSLVLLALFPVPALVGEFFNRKKAILMQTCLKIYEEAGSISLEAIQMIRTVISFGGQEREIKAYDAVLEKDKLWKRYVFINACATAFSSALFSVLLSPIFYIAGQMTLNGTISSGDLLNAFLQISSALTIFGTIPNLLSPVVEAQAVGPSVLDIVERVSEKKTGSTIPQSFKGHIELRNVSFSYPLRKDVLVLDKLNLTIVPGTSVALVGPSGSGKSTIMQLLLRVYEPDSGEILVDGVPLFDIEYAWWLQKIGYLGQEPALFQTTIAANIALGAPGPIAHVSPAAIEQACAAASAAKFVSQLPDGYDTIIGTGRDLSGGQQQRIAIARALVRDPRYLFLDEATSALDALSEAAVQDAVARASAGRTLVAIAHRLHTIKSYDAIYVLSAGRIVETGNHSSLMTADGTYAALVAEQALLAGDQPVGSTIEEDVIHSEEVQLDVKVADGYEMKPIDLKEKEKQDSTESEAKSKGPVKMIKQLPWYQQNKLLLIVGALGSLMVGLIAPLTGFIMGSNFASLVSDPDHAEKIRMYALMYLAIAAFVLLGRFMDAYCMGLSGLRLATALQRAAFRAVIWQDLAFFNRKENQAGMLNAVLASDAGAIRRLFSGPLSGVLVCMMTTAAAFGIAFTVSWRMTLTMLATLPLCTAIGFLEAHLSYKYERLRKTSVESCAQSSFETFKNLCTVVNLDRADHFVKIYEDKLTIAKGFAVKSSLATGIGKGLFVGAFFITYGMAFAFAFLLAENGLITSRQVYVVVLTLMLSVDSLSVVAQSFGDFSTARVALDSMERVIRAKPDIDPRENQGKTHAAVEGSITFEMASFRYEGQEEDQTVLRDINMDIPSGSWCAFVGESGSGKSTASYLLNRLYDTTVGKVSVDGVDVRGWNLQALRSSIGLIAQEPRLFRRTIRENIAYGKDGPVTHDEIVAAARTAELHDFVQSLPLGYDTMVGDGGGSLSGGQKQRVAIARAVIRDPKIMILDEATSALDAATANSIDKALACAARGRTTVMITHRLSTVQQADRIFVLANGHIVEAGRHGELVALGGVYANLVKQQSGAGSGTQ